MSTKPEVAIIASAEHALPGMAQMISSLATPLKNAQQKHVEAKLAAWDIIRKIYEYALNPSVVHKLEEINKHPDGRVREGRPKSGHRLLMDELVRTGKCSERTLNRWQNEWLEVAEKLKLEPGCSQRTFEGLIPDAEKIPAWIEKLTEAQESEGGSGGGSSSSNKPLKPEEMVEALTESVRSILFRNGKCSRSPNTRRDLRAMKMKRMAFSKTTPQMYARTKHVTRRDGWWKAKAGDCLTAIEKGMGLKKGEKQKVIRAIQIVSARNEALSRLLKDPEYGRQEMILEGFPGLDPKEFIEKKLKAKPSKVVRRIEFRFVKIHETRFGPFVLEVESD